MVDIFNAPKFPDPNGDQKKFNLGVIDALKGFWNQVRDARARISNIDSSKPEGFTNLVDSYGNSVLPSKTRGIELYSVTKTITVKKWNDKISFDVTEFPNEFDSLYANDLYVGSGPNIRIFHDGTDANIDTSIDAASDLIVSCGENKTLVLDEAVWDDLRINPGSFDRPGASDPSIVAYDVNGGGVVTYLYQFAKNNLASFTIQMPHGYKTGTDIYLHIHWTPGPNGVAESGNTVGWKVDYSWANLNSNFPTMTTADLSDSCDGVNHKHQMTPEVVISGAGKTLSSMLICNIKRTDTGADDTWSGTLSGALPMILEIDFHYEIDTVGSRDKGSK